MIVRASSASSKSSRLLPRPRLPESRNAESLRFWQFAHNFRYTGSVTHTSGSTNWINSSNPALKHPTRVQSLSSTSIGLRQSRPRTQYPRLQTSRPFSSSSHSRSSFAFSLESDPIMASLTPPQAPPKWNHTPEEVLSITKLALAQNKAVSDKVAALPEAECNFETVSDLSCVHRRTDHLLFGLQVFVSTAPDQLPSHFETSVRLSCRLLMQRRRPSSFASLLDFTRTSPSPRNFEMPRTKRKFFSGISMSRSPCVLMYSKPRPLQRKICENQVNGKS